MSNFHISKDGTARRCQAKTVDACRATKTDMKEHFETKEEAQKAYEEKMKEKGVTNKSLTKKEKVAAGNKRAEELLQNVKAKEKFDIDAALKDAAKYIRAAEKKIETEQRKAANMAKKEKALFADREKTRAEKQKAEDRVFDLVEGMLKVLKEKEKKDETGTLEYLDVLSDYNDTVDELVQMNSERDLSDYSSFKTYKNNVHHNHDYYSIEQKRLDEKIAEVEKTGRLKKAFNKEFREEQKELLSNLNQRKAVVEEQLGNLEWKKERIKAKEANRRRRILMGEGFKEPKRIAGWNMSLHPNGPMIQFQCPDCYSVSEARTGRMMYSKDVGFQTSCRACRSKILVPLVPTEQ